MSLLNRVGLNFLLKNGNRMAPIPIQEHSSASIIIMNEHEILHFPIPHTLLKEISLILVERINETLLWHIY